MWVCHVNIKNRKEAISLRKKIIKGSMIFDLEKNEAISEIVRDRAEKTIVFFLK